MKDRKTICEALKNCADDTPKNCRNCPYNKDSAECISDLMRDALALISVLETNGGGVSIEKLRTIAENDP